jgi:Ser/Thr protein kinase RdoA (MazF antagonist)
VEVDAIGAMRFFADKLVESIAPFHPEKYANGLYVVKTDMGRYVVRTLHRDETDMAVEYAVTARAATLGIAPKVYAFDSENRIMILEWIDGEHKRMLDRRDLETLATTLRKLHAIDTDTLPLSLPHARLEAIITPDTPAIADAFAVLAHTPRYDVLCHHDLNPLNLLWQNGEVKLLDFEYTRINDRCFDLAGVCVEFGLTDAEARYFVEVYLDSEGFDGEKIMAFRTLFEALCKQWNNAQT